MQTAISQDELVAGRKPTPIIRDAEQLLRRGIDALERDHFEDAAGLLRQAVDLAPESAMASLVRELRALERKRAPRRIWRPDFVGRATRYRSSPAC
jgi:hypothetical protein